jgi:hypothetical protein
VPSSWPSGTLLWLEEITRADGFSRRQTTVSRSSSLAVLIEPSLGE